MLKTDALAARGLEGIMWEACLTVLTVLPSASVCRVYSLRTLRAPAQFFATNRARKVKQDLQNILRPLQSCQRDITLLKHSAHSLV